MPDFSARPRGRRGGHAARGGARQASHGMTDQDLQGNQALLEQLNGTRTGANAVLFDLETSGASNSTASQDGLTGGVDASQTMAETDRARVTALKDAIETVASAHDLPPALLAAIASRETRGGNLLNTQGYSRYDGNGFGVMQVDKRYHDIEGTAKSQEHIDQAATILAGYRDQLARKFPDWTEAQTLRGAVAAYNTGPSNIKSYDDVDKRTTGGDYSADVWARARYYATWFGAVQEAPSS